MTAAGANLDGPVDTGTTVAKTYSSGNRTALIVQPARDRKPVRAGCYAAAATMNATLRNPRRISKEATMTNTRPATKIGRAHV